MPGRRILFLYPTLAVGGAEHQLAVLVPSIAEHGFEPVVATLNTRGRYFGELSDAGIPTLHVDMRSRFDVPALLRAYRLSRLEPDIVFTQGGNAQILGAAIARRAGAAHVTAEHAGAGLERAPHRALMTRLVAPRVQRVVCVSATQVQELRDIGYRDLAIRVIPNGIPEPRPTRPADETRRQLGLEADHVVFVLVAALRPEKRVELFIEALTRAHARDTRIRGLVVGDGPELERARARAREAAGAVLVLGQRADVPDLMACADAVCLTSYAEALPITVLEAMALGRPVVATAVGGIMEAVEHGGTGLLVTSGDPAAFADALLELASRPEERQAFGEAGRARFLRHYTVELMVQRYVDLLAEISDAERR